MKVVILAGGRGTRISEFTEFVPKPMIPINGQPILWHIMAGYASQGYDNFIVAAGYKADLIKRHFLEFASLSSDFEVDLGTGHVDFLEAHTPPWKVRVVDTGLDTLTGGRIKRLERHLNGDAFMLTYGDGVADVNVNQLLAFHQSHGRLATMTAVRPPARFGELTLEGNQVTSFDEKPQLGGGWINGGFFVFESGVLDYLEGDDQMLEREPLSRLAREGQLMAFEHHGFWQCMDTRRDHELLESLAKTGAPWVLKR